MRASILLYLIVAAISFTHCDARRSSRRLLDKAPITHQKSLFLLTAAKLNLVNYLNFDSSNSGSYSLSSPNSMPPYDSLAPIPLPENAPPYCSYPPNTPQSPSTAIPSPTGYTPSAPPSPFNLPPDLPIQNPPPGPTGSTPTPSGELPSPTGLTPTPSGGLPSPAGLTPTPSGGLPSPGFSPNPTSPITVPNPPEVVPSPTTTIPSPFGPILSPPYFEPTPSEPSLSPPYFEPSPPYFEPSPPDLVPNPPTGFPSPFGFNPSPPVFLPPIVFPPPTGPPPKRRGPALAAWCVAKPSVPDPIIQEAMNYACGSGADCDSILPSGSCFEPDTLFAHASYAFNSYWQRTKVAGGTCEFGGTAMLVTVDPSYDGCHFVHY